MPFPKSKVKDEPEAELTQKPIDASSDSQIDFLLQDFDQVKIIQKRPSLGWWPIIGAFIAIIPIIVLILMYFLQWS